MGLSPASIVKLKKIWETEFDLSQKRAITKKYVYMWVDGVDMHIRLGEDKKVCILVIIGVTENGGKEFLSVHPVIGSRLNLGLRLYTHQLRLTP